MSAGGPYLILAAFWLDEDETERVAASLRVADFPPPAGYPRGCVVAFRRAVASSSAFRRDLARLDLAEVNREPTGGPTKARLGDDPASSPKAV